MEKLLTVYTPTYNREKLLGNVYQSLCEQTSKNFIWMIVDDGSTDNTKKLVEQWINENIIEIIYYLKKNGGVHTARDFAYDNAKTELILGVDSDDKLMKNAVENIESIWKNKGEKEYCGILMPVISTKGIPIGSKFPNICSATYQEFTYKYHFKGDKQTILRTEIIREIQHAPIFENENLVGETYKWIQLPEIPFLIVDKYCKEVCCREDGYSKNARKNWFKNLNGFRAEYKQHIQSARYIKPRIKGNIGYIMTSLFLHDHSFILKSPRIWETIIFLPLGIMGYIYALIKWKKYM